MNKRQIFSGLFILTLVLAAVSCTKKDGEDPSPSNNLNRQPMLENYANNYVIPAYAEMETSINDFKATITAFVAAPDAAKLATAQKALAASYLQWQKTDLYEFGPAEVATLRSYMNTYPVTVSKVDANIASGSYDLEAFGNRDAQGFPAMDFLLNGTDPDSYTLTADADNRKAYLLAVVTKMAEKITAVKTEWTTYKNTFVSNTGTDANSSLSQMVNSYVLYYERYLRGGKVGIPVGVMTGSALPAHVESYYAPENSTVYAVAALQAVLGFYKGDLAPGASMKSYLEAIGTTDENGTLMSDLIEQEMTEAINSMNALNGTLVNNINTNRTEVLKTYDEIQDVVPLLKVDMVSAFSISITYTDNDGD